MSRRIEIVEVGPRDGLQNEQTLFDIDQKLEMIRRLELAGARRMEVVSFVNPKRVPQMAGAEELMAALAPDPTRSRIGLVLNLRGWDRCVAAGCDEANVVVCASDGFGIRNQGASVDEQVAAMADMLRNSSEADIEEMGQVFALAMAKLAGERSTSGGSDRPTGRHVPTAAERRRQRYRAS